MDLVHCIYCSAAADPGFGLEDLAGLLAASRRKNARLGITGILLFDEGVFFQVLEGERVVVEELYETIAADERHARVRKIILEPIEERNFGEWSMGLSDVGVAELRRIPGLNDFFTEGRSFMDLEEGRAKSLLEAFREGLWRTTLHDD